MPGVRAGPMADVGVKFWLGEAGTYGAFCPKSRLGSYEVSARKRLSFSKPFVSLKTWLYLSMSATSSALALRMRILRTTLRPLPADAGTGSGAASGWRRPMMNTPRSSSLNTAPAAWQM